MRLSSPAFVDGGQIPKEYTCDGANLNPPLVVGDVPSNAQSLALIVDDPDAPAGTFTHWLVWNIPVESSLIPQGGLPDNSLEGVNSFGNSAYDGPCPPSGRPAHRYFFRLFALDTALDYLTDSSRRIDLESSLSGHILEQTELMGTYGRS